MSQSLCQRNQSELLTSASRQRLLSLRSALLGFAGVIGIAILTPYNNFVVDQAGIIGNSLSIGAVCFCVLIVGTVNALLFRIAPRFALSRSEIAVSLGMVLVGSAIPGVGLMRYLPGQLIGPFYHAAEQPEYAALLRSLHLPDWLFPRFEHSDPAARGNEALVRYFYGRIPQNSVDTFRHRLMAIPWNPWLQPFATWGIFIALLMLAVMCLTIIFRRQWVENERLPFPLATVYAALIEPPNHGRSFNRLFRSRGFQWAAAGVFIIQFCSGLHQYFPNVPAVPLGFDIRGILSDSPFWSQADSYLCQQQIYFTVIGIAFFLRLNVLSSLVVCYLIGALTGIIMRGGGTDFTLVMQRDQQFGSGFVMILATLWIARQHLAVVLRQMIGRFRASDLQDVYLPYPLAGWGLTLAAAGMVCWLKAANMSLGGAIVVVLMLLAIMLLVARVIAETGILYVLVAVPLSQPMLYTASLTGGNPLRATMESFYVGRLLSNIFTNDTREALPNFTTTALRLTDHSIHEPMASRRSAAGYVGLLLASLLVSYIIAGGSTLFCFYNYSATLGSPSVAPIQQSSTLILPQMALNDTLSYLPRRAASSAASHLPAFSSGAVGALILSLLSLRFAGWPLAPVGLLLSSSWGLKMTWFSLLVGLVTKKILIRLGGGKLIQSAQPIFIGLIVGEVAAVAFWMLTALLLSATGHEYKLIQLLPI